MPVLLHIGLGVGPGNTGRLRRDGLSGSCRRFAFDIEFEHVQTSQQQFVEYDRLFHLRQMACAVHDFKRRAGCSQCQQARLFGRRDGIEIAPYQVDGNLQLAIGFAGVGD